MKQEILWQNSFPANQKTDPALARYPQALAELLTFGEPEEELDYTDWADELGDYVPDLIRMVLDDDLSERDDDDPAWCAPIHAIEVLCVLGPIEAAEPLLACFDWDEDWLFDASARLVRGHWAGVCADAAGLSVRCIA